jgi:N-methylhydantoinase B/oxoprolinase/acetone carboxylase alpha subunit
MTCWFHTAGGGGYGPAAQRSPELIERDHRFGYVSTRDV